MTSFLPGLKAMLNYHPLFVHFPIAFWIGALVFESLAVMRSSDELHRTAARLLYFGTLLGFVALVTGLYAADSVPEAGPAHEAMEVHELLMKITQGLALGLSLLSFFLRANFTAGRRKMFLLGLLVLAALLAVGADRGAQLVYQYGSGVNWPTATPQK